MAHLNQYLQELNEKDPVSVKLIEAADRGLALKIKSLPTGTPTKSTSIPVSPFSLYSNITVDPEHRSGYDSKLLEIQDILGYTPASATPGGILRYFTPQEDLQLFQEEGLLNPRMTVSLCSKIIDIISLIDRRTNDDPRAKTLPLREIGIHAFDPEKIKHYKREISSNPKYR